MSPHLKKSAVRPLASLLFAVVAAVLWAAWLGWDQHRDVHPDGSTTGPYQPWQVIGLVLTLLVPVCWGALRCDARSVVAGTSAGLTFASFYDWSDDATGLFGVGVTLVLLGSLAATGTVAAVLGHRSESRGPA
ncbi:hypothetical protein EV284_4132 [Streptomyces sp. BK022]|uniref:hypothetical protein n=1 Tax=Streptomyces sp. BK022 TaxID=2512123 RepID=UPI00102905B7|nr:hypothetical protein [Streptomyces sp. BK022]RZU36637.1 hypothetical protein EV284_4132 [Streptomyces sp. BK022]